MAVLTGISGYSGTITDGKGGNTPLDLRKSIVRWLSTRGFSYKLATPIDPSQANAGSVTYRIPEIVQVEDYTQQGQDGGRFQGIAAGDITITIDIRRWAGIEYEEFDYSRLGDMSYIVSSAISSLGLAIEKDLNAHFWTFLADAFNPQTGTMRTQNIVLPELVKDNPNVDEVKGALYKLQRFLATKQKTHNKLAMGIPKAEFMVFLDPIADINIRHTYYNQPNALAERVIAKDLVGTQLGGGLFYYVDDMLGNSIAAGTSFSKDKALDTTAFPGFIIHNEAIAMPMNLKSVKTVVNPQTGNTRLLCKYQFGIGFVRPWLCFSITNVPPTRMGKN